MAARKYPYSDMEPKEESMLGINIDDVINVLISIRPQLIAIGVALVLALIVTVAVNRRTVASQAVRKLVHAETWIAAAIATIVAVSLMLFGPLSTMLSLVGGSAARLDESTIRRANDFAVQIERTRCTAAPVPAHSMTSTR